MARIVHVLVLEGQWRRQQMPLDLWQRHWSSRLGSGFSYGNAPHSSWRLDCISVRCMAYGVSFVAIFSLNPKAPRYLGERGRTSDDFLICEGAEQLPTNDFTINRIGISTSSMSLNARVFFMQIFCQHRYNLATTSSESLIKIHRLKFSRDSLAGHQACDQACGKYLYPTPFTKVCCQGPCSFPSASSRYNFACASPSMSIEAGPPSAFRSSP